MIVPPGIVAMVLIWFALAEYKDRSRAQLDWTGFLALSVAITGLQLMIDRGQRLDWFESPEICLEAFTAAIAFWIFVAHSLTASRPFLDPRLLLDRNFAIGLVLAFFMGMLAFTSLVLLPGMLHDLRDYPDSAIGLLLASRGARQLDGVPGRRAVLAALSAAVGRHRAVRAGLSPPGRWRSSTSMSAVSTCSGPMRCRGSGSGSPSRR